MKRRLYPDVMASGRHLVRRTLLGLCLALVLASARGGPPIAAAGKSALHHTVWKRFQSVKAPLLELGNTIAAVPQKRVMLLGGLATVAICGGIIWSVFDQVAQYHALLNAMYAPADLLIDADALEKAFHHAEVSNVTNTSASVTALGDPAGLLFEP